jgi:hypothetical protein
MHARLLDLYRSYAGREGPSRHTAIPHYLTTALVITHMAVRIDPAGDLGLNRLSKKSLRSLPQDLA